MNHTQDTFAPPPDALPESRPGSFPESSLPPLFSYESLHISHEPHRICPVFGTDLSAAVPTLGAALPKYRRYYSKEYPVFPFHFVPEQALTAFPSVKQPVLSNSRSDIPALLPALSALSPPAPVLSALVLMSPVPSTTHLSADILIFAPEACPPSFVASLPPDAFSVQFPRLLWIPALYSALFPAPAFSTGFPPAYSESPALWTSMLYMPDIRPASPSSGASTFFPELPFPLSDL